MPADHALKTAELGQESLHNCLAWARGEPPDYAHVDGGINITLTLCGFSATLEPLWKVLTL